MNLVSNLYDQLFRWPQQSTGDDSKIVIFINSKHSNSLPNLKNYTELTFGQINARHRWVGT